MASFNAGSLTGRSDGHSNCRVYGLSTCRLTQPVAPMAGKIPSDIHDEITKHLAPMLQITEQIDVRTEAQAFGHFLPRPGPH
jgi:hypothetical protein